MKYELSVVIVPLRGGENLKHCLQALRDQSSSTSVEMIVPYDDRIEGIDALRTEFPEVNFVRLAIDPTYAHSRAAAMRIASADLVALTEDQCLPAPGWCAEVVRCHQNSAAAAIGGAVEKGFRSAKQTDGILSWSIYFCDYIRYANPIAEGGVANLTDCNVSYKKSFLDEILPLWQQAFHENVVHAALLEKGKTLEISPRMIVRQQRSITLMNALRERFQFGKLFGSTRASGSAARKRAAHVLFVPALPFLLTLRITVAVFQKRKYRLQFVKSSPLIFLLNSFWSLGEFAGYLNPSPNASGTPQHVSA